jgi:hypothetical protein
MDIKEASNIITDSIEEKNISDNSFDSYSSCTNTSASSIIIIIININASGFTTKEQQYFNVDNKSSIISNDG